MTLTVYTKDEVPIAEISSDGFASCFGEDVAHELDFSNGVFVIKNDGFIQEGGLTLFVKKDWFIMHDYSFEGASLA